MPTAFPRKINRQRGFSADRRASCLHHSFAPALRSTGRVIRRAAGTACACGKQFHAGVGFPTYLSLLILKEPTIESILTFRGAMGTLDTQRLRRKVKLIDCVSWFRIPHVNSRLGRRNDCLTVHFPTFRTTRTCQTRENAFSPAVVDGLYDSVKSHHHNGDGKNDQEYLSDRHL